VNAFQHMKRLFAVFNDIKSVVCTTEVAVPNHRMQVISSPSSS
jgi:hypothetical protein